jgi:hypothetical protein
LAHHHPSQIATGTRRTTSVTATTFFILLRIKFQT